MNSSQGTSSLEGKMVPCPRCRRSTEYRQSNPFRPFCSRRCKDEDIVAWAKEDYKVGSPLPDEEEGGPPEE